MKMQLESVTVRIPPKQPCIHIIHMYIHTSTYIHTYHTTDTAIYKHVVILLHVLAIFREVLKKEKYSYDTHYIMIFKSF
jgi:hypothetical protein